MYPLMSRPLSMPKTLLGSLALGLLPVMLAAAPAPADFHAWASTPPMGWNSWDNFGTTVTEAQTKAQADVMASELKSHGWQYVVVDIQWYEAGTQGHSYKEGARLSMDGYGRLQPAVSRFPSSADGRGFAPLAAYVHSLGLKFGIHLMRGIPRQAVEENLPILGTPYHARDIADRVHTCPWNPDMYGVDMSKPGAQAYYDSVFSLIASWGVDFVKVDDLSRPYFQNIHEVEAIRKAIDRTGRPMVLSLSPGATDIRAAAHVRAHANMWRISDDFWDRWLALKGQFHRLALWNPWRETGAWPDADMLPLGRIMMDNRASRFTPDEQVTLMTLWSIARSPLIFGGDLTKLDPFTRSLITNDEVIAVDQHSADNRPLFDHDGLIAWTAKDPADGSTYLAVFNTRDRLPLTEANARQPSSVLTADPATAARIDVDLRGATTLVLVAIPTEERDGLSQVVWRAPRFVFADGSVRSVTERPWLAADAQWDSAQIRREAHGTLPSLVAQAAAEITYAIPAGAVRFEATAAIDGDKGAGGGPVRVLTVVGTSDNTDRGPGLTVAVPLASLGFEGKVKMHDLWTHKDLGEASGTLSSLVPFHGARLFKLTKE
ncbi:alpha-galactosidase A precursor [mine drainage metagenome]|uniref:Alpha-galactosidase A n=1 Tax=mine drainage metagenome TaxID=410659 RepID=A0A1J5SI07_9ZZZZ